MPCKWQFYFTFLSHWFIFVCMHECEGFLLSRTHGRPEGTLSESVLSFLQPRGPKGSNSGRVPFTRWTTGLELVDASPCYLLLERVAFLWSSLWHIYSLILSQTTMCVCVFTGILCHESKQRESQHRTGFWWPNFSLLKERQGLVTAGLSLQPIICFLRKWGRHFRIHEVVFSVDVPWIRDQIKSEGAALQPWPVCTHHHETSSNTTTEHCLQTLRGEIHNQVCHQMWKQWSEAFPYNRLPTGRMNRWRKWCFWVLGEACLITRKYSCHNGKRWNTKWKTDYTT